jgi:hypothetical protein
MSRNAEHLTKSRDPLPKLTLARKRSAWGRAPSYALSFMMLSGVLAFAQLASGQSSPDTTKTEARDHFDRGLRLFNQLDNEGALAEFTRAYDLVPHVLVLQNIGLVQAAMGRPVQAVESFNRLLANPAGLDAASIERIRIERDRQNSQIAEVDVTANVAAALVEVDGIEVGRSPLTQALRLAKGTHVIGVIASGYVPLRKQVTLVGASRTQEKFDLLPSEAGLTHIEVRSRIPKLDLYLDGEFVGQTPLPASLAIAPGQHRLESKRAGYAATSRSINLGPGSTGAVEIEPEIDPRLLAVEGGELALMVSEAGSMVFVDGASHGQYDKPLRLVSGEHWVRIEHADFFPVERKVTVAARRLSEVAIELKPTPEHLEQYRRSVARRNVWGWTTTGAGSLLTAGSVGFLIWNSGQKSDRKAAFDAQVARAAPGADCDPKGIQTATCRTELQLALDNLEHARSRDTLGWVGLGVGAAALGVGLYLLIGNDVADRYAPRPQSDVFGQLRWKPTAWLSKDTTGAGVVGAF